MENIRLTSVDKYIIEEGYANDEYTFYVNLNEEPDPYWVDFFRNNQRKILVGHSPKMEIEGKKIKIFIYHEMDKDNLQGIADLVKKLIEQTNKDYDEHLKEQKRKQEIQKAKEEEKEKKKQELREKLKEIKI